MNLKKIIEVQITKAAKEFDSYLKGAAPEVPVQEQSREDLVLKLNTQILKLLERNGISYLEWRKLSDILEFDMKKYCRLSIGNEQSDLKRPKNPEDYPTHYSNFRR